MPPSQLKRLKNTLREKGVVGPQRSKRQKKRASKDGSGRDERVQRSAALQSIREQFNPFETRALIRNKHDVAISSGGKAAKNLVVGRPGVTKGLGEENRRKTLLVEMQQRKKVGGILDRRFGENDPTMNPEEKALERFVKERQKGNRKGALFDLEDAEEDGQITHFGELLSFDRPSRLDDFKELEIEVSDAESLNQSDGERPLKRRRIVEELKVQDNVDVAPPERPKTKKEVMSEVIAKSKLHKYERQQAKEDDDDLRAELDKGLRDVFTLLRANPRAHAPAQKQERPDAAMNPDRAALLNEKDRAEADREYDERLRQMIFDQRSKPTDRTLTEEEKLRHEAQKLKELEERRLRRMRGEPDSSEEDGSEERPGLGNERPGLGNDEGIDQDEGNAFGLGPGLLQQSGDNALGVEDEDDFIIEDNLVANDSDLDFSGSEANEESENESSDVDKDEDDTEFTQGLLSNDDVGRKGLLASSAEDARPMTDDRSIDLAYIYPCPLSHNELLHITNDIPINSLNTVIQRIRALYHPKLHCDNKAKLASFSVVLVEHISFLANQSRHPPFFVLEAIIRHVHSLSKTFSEEIGRAFQSHLKCLHADRPTAPTPGDLIILTAVGSIFPTSDHFHQVVTPAALCMTRYLSQKVPQSLSDIANGTYIQSLCLQYQRVSKRYVPELVNYTLGTLLTLAPVKGNHLIRSFPYHAPGMRLHIEGTPTSLKHVSRLLKFADIIPVEEASAADIEALKLALLNSHLKIIGTMANIWSEKLAFCEIFTPILLLLQHLASKPCSAKLTDEINIHVSKLIQVLGIMLNQSRLARLPLTLHNHRPLPIKSFIPKFEENYHPDRHYDPDRERAENSKLKAEHKRERKGALRELRKDANFMARERLKEKKERDSEYEKKYKRLVAEIQGEEGREAKSYEREKRMRKGSRKN